jgi:hypothetical protein
LISLVAVLLFVLIPIDKYANPNLGNALKEGGRGSSDGRERHRARNTLVVAQVALAMVLLVASGLMIRTFAAMQDISPGFTNPAEILTFRVSIPTAIAKDPPAAVSMHEQIVRRIEALPGITSVGFTTSVTMDGFDNNDPIFREDKPTPEGQMAPLRRFKWVAENYFKTMGRTLIAGRDISWADVHGAAPVAIITESLARELYGEPAAAIGQRIRNTPQAPWREIVGVVGNEHDDGVTKGATTVVYWPIMMRDFWQPGLMAQRNMAYVIRTPRLQDQVFFREVQQAVWSVNSNLPLANVRTVQEF